MLTTEQQISQHKEINKEKDDSYWEMNPVWFAL